VTAYLPDFTEAEYEALVQLAASHYRFIDFDGLDSEPPVVLWRHDIDCSPQRALALARIEARRGARATYFVNAHSDFYNLLEPLNVQAVLAIVGLGHNLGLHFDPYAVSTFTDDLEPWLARERQLLQDVFGVEVRAFSTHNPTLVDGLDTRDNAAGMVNASGEGLVSRFEYCSDSNGLWRFQPLRVLLEQHKAERLHVLTHPDWWVPTELSPRARISRAIDGRAAAQHTRYDELLEGADRPNVR
jgi:hypothetical protein